MSDFKDPFQRRSEVDAPHLVVFQEADLPHLVLQVEALGPPHFVSPYDVSGRVGALMPVSTTQHRVAAHFPMEHNLNNF